MNNPFTHTRKSSDVDPFEVAETYYGDNPGKFGRVRTFSVVENKSKFFDDFRKLIGEDTTGSKGTLSEHPSLESSNGSQSSLTPDIAPPENSDLSDDMLALTRRQSIMPIYDDLSADAVNDLDYAKVQARIMSHRRASVDDSNIRPKKFFISDIDLTLKELLANEDTDNNCQITIEDTGPKVLNLGTANSNGFKQSQVRGTYMLSNLLQELTIAQRFGRNQLVLDEERLSENPVNRMKRLISTEFWKSLTRQTNRDNIVEMSKDVKFSEEYVDQVGNVQKGASHRIYVPHSRTDQYNYFSSIKLSSPHIHLDVQYLPEVIDAHFIKSINDKPGLLALSAKIDPENPGDMISQPYVVPGGRFNELYGWDSYMETIGLLTDVTSDNQEHLRLSRGMTENFIYEIHYYGKILNANRSYYLGRSQPPFLTDMTLRVFNKTMEVAPERQEDSLDFLRRATLAAIKEYNTVWCAVPRLDEETGLSCYHPAGIGIPPETESTHFDAILQPYIDKYNVSREEFIEMYNDQKVSEPELDEYFLHDRAVRESGHDTSYRLEGKCAHLATVDLNSLLFKYEVDIAFILTTYFNDDLEFEGAHHKPIEWIQRAENRKKNITKYLWNEEDSIFYDYNVKTKEQTGYESATAFWPLWSKAASKDQAEKLVRNSLPKLEEFGGLVAGTLRSRGDVGLTRPSRQWDYPFGWAPQQILAWIGLSNYGYDGCARRLVYRWLYMMTRAFVDYNGVVVEKYNVTKGAVPHKVDAEYGNQGLDFKGVATEGFGWVNSSYLFGLTFMNLHAKRCLGTLTPPDVFLRYMHPQQRSYYE